MSSTVLIKWVVPIMQFWSAGLSISTRDVVNGDDMVDSKVEKIEEVENPA
jgi:hypothetical protein